MPKAFNYVVIIICLTVMPAILLAHQYQNEQWDIDFSRFTETPPPVAPVRPVAEFEPASQVLIRYPLGIPVSLVVQLANTAQVICLVSSSSTQNAATNAFLNAGVNMDKVTFMIASTDSYWTRDYGPWFIFDGNGDLGVVDFQYNRPRPNDNLIPQIFANQQELPYYGMNLVQTGGNYMNDGINTAAQTNLVYSENSSLSQQEVYNRMHNYLGIENYYVLADPNNTYIDHIDCWGKFLAPDKILIRSVSSSHSQYNAIEQVASYFSSTLCAWGYPYKVYRVYTPQNQPYTNSLILNNRVFVPIMNSSYDAAALQAYRDAMPGYEVIGVPATSSAPWESTDALHCRTHEIPDKNMLEIVHNPYFGSYANYSNWQIDANIIARSGQALYPDSVYVCYKINQESWQNVIMSQSSGNHYETTLPAFAPGDTIRYFIHSADQSGHSRNHPVFAALEPHLFVCAPDSEAPIIYHNPPTSIQSGEHTFSAIVTDNFGVDNVVFRYKIDEGEATELAMTYYPEIQSDYWTITLNLTFNQEDEFFHYQIEARDNANPYNITCYPWLGEWLNIPIKHTGIQDESVPSVQKPVLISYPNPYFLQKNIFINIVSKNINNERSSLKLFNSRGQLVKCLSVSESSPEFMKYQWDGKDSNGKKVDSGIYF
ncbi:MAG TPA: agmatine deiminase family protein, partial [Candidatus Syntrophosphaera thermopropionivorans]|nr:agmatine deiminase family protein [Candidatus Syntrophosphaera thermopropionivorans]